MTGMDPRNALDGNTVETGLAVIGSLGSCGNAVAGQKGAPAENVGGRRHYSAAQRGRRRGRRSLASARPTAPGDKQGSYTFGLRGVKLGCHFSNTYASKARHTTP